MQNLMIPIREIWVDRDGPQKRVRTEFKNIPQLAESIKTNGLIEPIVVVEEQNGDPTRKFKLLAGERRYRACVLAGLTEVPIRLYSQLSLVQQKLIELEENLQRESISWQEECENYRQIDELKRKELGQSVAQVRVSLAKETNESEDSISRKIQMGKMLKQNPDVAERVQNLPYVAARRKAKQLIKVREATGSFQSLLEDQRLICGDCIKELKTFDSDSIDLLLTDPPFGNEVIASSMGRERGTVQSYTVDLAHTDNLTVSELKGLLQPWAHEVHRVLKPGSHFYVFFEMENLSTLTRCLLDAGLEIEWPVLVWNKGRSTSPFKGYSYSPCYEIIVFGYKPPRTKMLHDSMTSLLSFSSMHSTIKIHAFEKPQDLLQTLIRQSTQENDLVLDTFCGSGSTVRAALTLRRRAIGIDSNQEHITKAQMALENTMKALEEARSKK